MDLADTYACASERMACNIDSHEAGERMERVGG
jgi:hypothetical protein